MAEPDKRQTGDGQDNLGQAASKGAQAFKQASQASAEKAASAGFEAASNASAAAVQAGAEGGKAVAEVASGTAAGGPWGAIIAAAWASRHTLFKILICICLLLVFLISAVVSLPSIVVNSLFKTDPDTVWAAEDADMFEITDDLSSIVGNSVQAGLDNAMARVNSIITDNGYDYDASMEALIDYGSTSMEYDLCYILAAYSASMEQKGTTPSDMQAKLATVTGRMFDVTYEEKSFQREIPATPPAEGEEPDPDAEPVYETVYYAECTIHPFNQMVIVDAFGLDMEAQYGAFNITTSQAILNMANALKLTMYGSLTGGEVPPLTDAEMIAILNGLDCSATRKKLIRTALSLVGRVSYFWGGKSAAGWNDSWGTPKLVTAPGSTSSGTIRPYGLDCSGFTEWVYVTVGLGAIGGGSDGQYYNNISITADELKPGDLGFKADDDGVGTDHVLMYVGKDAEGNRLWVHCSSGSNGVVLNSPSYVVYYCRVADIDLESNVLPSPAGS